MEIPTEQCALMRRVLARFDVTLVAVSLGHVMHLNDLIVPPTQRTRNHKERPGRLSQAAAWPTAGSAHNMSSIHGNTDGVVREVQPPPAQELQLLLSRLTQLLASNLDKQLEQESRRVRLLMALVKMVGLTDDPEEMLRQLELLTPNGDTDIQKWLDGDGSRWVRRPSGTAGLWLDV